MNPNCPLYGGGSGNTLTALLWPRTPKRGAFFIPKHNRMNQNNNPSQQHRPNRWARIKKQLTQARAEAERATQRLTISQSMSKMYEAQIDGFFKMIGAKEAHIDKLINIIEKLNERVMQQREEIQVLKKQLQYNDNARGRHNQPLHRTAAPTSTQQGKILTQTQMTINH